MAYGQLLRRLLGLAEELGLHVQELGAEVILLRNGHPEGSKGREDLTALQVKMLTLFVEAGQLKAAAKQVAELPQCGEGRAEEEGPAEGESSDPTQRVPTNGEDSVGAQLSYGPGAATAGQGMTDPTRRVPARRGLSWGASDLRGADGKMLAAGDDTFRS